MQTTKQVSTIGLDELAKENEELRRRLTDLEAEVRAIRMGEVDAVLVEGERGQVYTLETPYAPYRLVVAQMREAGATLTPQGRIITCNRRFAELVQRPQAALPDQDIRDLVHADCHGRLGSWLEAGLEGATEALLDLVRSDGSRVKAYLSARPLEEGALGKALVVIDVTQERQYVELQRAQRALREADRRKDEFLATLAHELRNPLAPIRNAVDVLALKMPKEPQLQWARGVLERQVEHMARLLDDLLDVSRVALLKPDLQRETLDLTWVVRAAVETSQPLIEAAEHELVLSLPDEPLNVDGDPIRLAQVFGNLLNNAAKYTEGGGRIEVTVERQDQEAVVSVKDNGEGLDAELLPHVFDLFSRAKTALVRARGGLGIGLSLVKALVEQHGGTVEARSEGIGAGSEFVVRLPIAESGPTEARPLAEGAGSGCTYRILVVDDNRDSAGSLAMLLQLWGHEVETAFSGQHALDVGAKLRPHAVFLDIGMPGMDGYETCRRMRGEPWGREALVVALTGLGQDDDQRRSREAGFDHHAIKPVAGAALIELLESLERRAGEGA